MHDEFTQVALSETERRLSELAPAQREYLVPIGTLRSWVENGVLALIAEAPAMTEVHDSFMQRYGSRYPDLFTTKPGVAVALDMGGQAGLAVSNRVDGVVGFRVQPGATFTILRHWQFFHRENQQSGYPVPAAFVAGFTSSDTVDAIRIKFARLVERTAANVNVAQPRYG